MPLQLKQWFNSARRITRMKPNRLSFPYVAGVFLVTASALLAQTTGAGVQVDVTKLLNDRVVVTSPGGQAQSSLHGIDSANHMALLTKGATSGEGNALPDNDLFPANSHHPAIKLHYAGPGSQVRRLAAHTESFTFEVTPQRYRQLQIILTSAQGETPLEVHMIYADGTNGKREATAPDCHQPRKNDDPRWFALAGDLAVADPQGKPAANERVYLHGFDLNPDPTKKLLKVEVIKLESPTVLSFFGAAGMIAESGHSSKSSSTSSGHRRRR